MIFFLKPNLTDYLLIIFATSCPLYDPYIVCFGQLSYWECYWLEMWVNRSSNNDYDINNTFVVVVQEHVLK